MATIGDRIKTTRKRRGIQQIDLATKIGISKQSLYKYENNIITNIPSDKIEMIANELNVTPAYLMGWDIPDTDSALYRESIKVAQEVASNPDHQGMKEIERKIRTEDLVVAGPEPARSNGYYTNPETAAIAQKIFDNPDLRILFDAAQDVKPENLQLAAEMLRRFKETNPDA